MSEGIHTIVMDKSVLEGDEPTEVFSVPPGYFARFLGEPRLNASGNMEVRVVVEKALPNGCRQR
jgi:hypothetical protein